MRYLCNSDIYGRFSYHFWYHVAQTYLIPVVTTIDAFKVGMQETKPHKLDLAQKKKK